MTNIEIVKGPDFWWVVVDGKPSFACATQAEAIEIAALLR